MPQAHIGVIGGSGLYRMEGMSDVEEIAVQTPFGDPSDVITVGKVEGVSMAFLPRHGRGHRISPTEIPVRANIWALKSLGVEWVISVSAVGSLREHIAPRDLVIPNQLFDRTKSRVNSFFEGGIVVHCTFAEPFCSTLSRLLLESARELGDVKVHEGGAYVCMEGPLFSTKAESLTYRSWGMDIIGMTALPEAKLARVERAGDGRDGDQQPERQRRQCPAHPAQCRQQDTCRARHQYLRLPERTGKLDSDRSGKDSRRGQREI